MDLRMIGLGRMGTNVVRRLMKAGHPCVVYDLPALSKEGAVRTTSLEGFAKKLKSPRAVWMMLPAAGVDPTRKTLKAAVDESVPAPVLRAAPYQRFNSRGEDDFADKMLSALRYQFGGHEEKAAAKKTSA
jgi:6-phosphogluconate dehydrogenase (decarboxylating)